MGTIGHLCEIPGKIKYKWKIEDFFKLSCDSNIHFESPKFYFAGASWVIRIFPNGEAKKDTDGWISLYIARMSSGRPIAVDYSFSIKTVGGKIDPFAGSKVFDKRKLGFGIQKFISKKELMDKKHELVPSNVLTILCTMRTSEPNDITDSLYHRLQAVSNNLLELYVENNSTDGRINFIRNITHNPVNKIKARYSAVLTDTNKNHTENLTINDTSNTELNDPLLQMYSRDPNSITKETVMPLYCAAENFCREDVKKTCCKFILRNLSVEWVCDVLQFAELYKEEKLSWRAWRYFKENANEILESEKWRTFVKENPYLSMELLESLISVLL